MKNLIATSLVIMSLSSPFSMAKSGDNFDAQLLALQHKWANVNYTIAGDAQKKAFEKLLTTAKSFAKAFPERAETWVWQGIIQSSYAGAKGGLGALSLAKQAKKSLEKAINIDGNALSGSAYTSLGTLYHKVPGWPIAFGDDDDAKVFLEKAIAINPSGIDANYFYGEYMLDKRKYKQAKSYLLKAQAAPAREYRLLADKYRQGEIEALLTKVNKKLNKSH
ncbi:tetratricopeptide repeat protein [Colwelliaceae bacterium 6441]